MRCTDDAGPVGNGQPGLLSVSYEGPPQVRAVWRNHLPHWDVVGRPIFLTIHVRGAIPQSAVKRIQIQAAEIAACDGPDHLQRLKTILTSMEAWLHRPSKAVPLTNPEVVAMLREAIETREKRGWWLPTHWVIMPNHLHVLYLAGSVGMKKLIEDFKRWTGRRAAALLGTTGERVWQSEWFDHWSRSADETDYIAFYIRRNPERAGLATNGEAWPNGSWYGLAGKRD